MTAENVQVVRRFFEALADAGRASTPAEDLMQRFAREDVVYVEDPRWPGSDTYRGDVAVGECWSKYDELLGDAAAVSVVEVRDAGNEVVAIVQVSGRARESGVPYDHTWGYVCRTEDGRLSYFRAYLDFAEALEAAGLSP